MEHTRSELEDKLNYKIKEQKMILNNVSLVIVVWIMCIALGLFVSRDMPEIQDTIKLIGILSIIPVVLLELKIMFRWAKVKKEKTIIEETRIKLEPRDDEETYGSNKI